MFHAAELYSRKWQTLCLVSWVFYQNNKKMRGEEMARVLKALAVQAWEPESKSQHPYKTSGMPCMCLQLQHCGLGQRQENGYDLLATAYSRFSKRNNLKRTRWRAIEQDAHSPPLPLCMHSCTHAHLCMHHSHMHCTHTKSKPTH